MGKISRELDGGIYLAEVVMAIKENTNAIQQNINETRMLAELLKPALKKTETLRFKKLQDQELLNDCLSTVKQTHG
jgi:hypothetical protein